MNNRRVLNFVWMVTAAGWRRMEVLKLVEALRYISNYELDELLSTARDGQKEFNALHLSGRGDMFVSPVPSDSAPADIDEKVLQLLRVEAGLSAAEAIRSMSASLRKLDKARSLELPGYSKQSLGSWVRRAAKTFSPSELLYVATTIRNASVHGAQLDWGLRKNES